MENNYNLMNIPNLCNYIEIYIGKKFDHEFFNSLLDENVFYEYLKKFSKSNYKFFQSDFKIYKKNDLILQKTIDNNEVTETKVYQYNTLFFNDTNNTRTIFFEKQKLSPVGFPSTSNLNEIILTRRLTMRVNNKIYINFDIDKDTDNILYYKIYINININKNTDTQDIYNKIKEIINILGLD